MNLNITGIKLTSSQKELWRYANDNHHKYIIANWSRQSGKSTIVSLLCIKWLAMKEQEIIYITPTYSLAKKIYSNIIKLLPEEMVLKSNSSDLIIESILKSRLVFFSAESGQAIRRKYCYQTYSR
jgi:replicative superfamily II helicase